MRRELDGGGLVGFQGEVDFSGFPVFAGFLEDGGDQPQQRGLVGEQRGDADAAFANPLTASAEVIAPLDFNTQATYLSPTTQIRPA